MISARRYANPGDDQAGKPKGAEATVTLPQPGGRHQGHRSGTDDEGWRR